MQANETAMRKLTIHSTLKASYSSHCRAHTLLPSQMLAKAQQCIGHKCRAMPENYISSRQSVMSQTSGSAKSMTEELETPCHCDAVFKLMPSIAEVC